MTVILTWLALLSPPSLHPALEGTERRRLGYVQDLLDPHQPAPWGETHRVRRESRPGPGRGQDDRVLADGQGDVHPHVHDVRA